MVTKPENKFYVKSIAFVILFLCFALSISAQRTSEKYSTIVSGVNTPIDNISGGSNLHTIGYIDPTFHVESSSTAVIIQNSSTAHGEKSFVLEYTKNNTTNYRIYHLNFVPSILKAEDDYITWDGVGPLTIAPLQNDNYTGVVTISINQCSGIASPPNTNNEITYSNTNFSGLDYIHYTITDAAGNKDQAIIKLAQEMAVPSQDESHHFTVNYAATKDITVPDGFEIFDYQFHGSLELKDNNQYTYTPDEYFIGQDSFSFSYDGVIIKYIATIIDAEKDPGIVRNDKVFTSKNKVVSFDVFANDVVNVYPIDSFYPATGLVLDSLGHFTYTPPSNFKGVKQFTYEVNTGTQVEKGKVSIYVGNFNPIIPDGSYSYEIPGFADFVIEYDVPIDGYYFTTSVQPQHGTASTFIDSTEYLNCGTAFGKAMITYTPDPGFMGSDSMSIKYKVPGSSDVTYKLYFHVMDNSTNCGCMDDCVWNGDLNGDGRVNASDLLTLGRYMGYTGPSRSNATGVWRGNTAADWGIITTNGRDLKHADANGDGQLTAADADSIIAHYGKFNGLVAPENLAYKEFPFTIIPSATELDSGDVLTLYFKLGSSTIPANDVHGLSFGLDLPNWNIVLDTTQYGLDSSTAAIQYYNDSWFTDNSPMLSLENIDLENGKIRTAVTRTQGKGISGEGIIGQMSIIIEEADGAKEDNKYALIPIISEDITIEDANGERYNLEANTIKIKYNRSKKQEKYQGKDKINLYPNPSQDGKVYLVANGNEALLWSYELSDMSGRVLSSASDINQPIQELNTTSLSQGIYLVKVASSNGVEVKKLVVE